MPKGKRKVTEVNTQKTDESILIVGFLGKAS